MFIKTKVVMVGLVLLVLQLTVISTVSAQEIWNMQQGTSWIIGNKTQCTVIEYNRPISFAPTIPEKMNASSAKYNWPSKTAAQKIACDQLKQAANYTEPKIYKVAVNPRYPNNQTRPTKNLVSIGNSFVLGAKANVRAVIGTTCGEVIKRINSRYAYHEVSINNSSYAVICE